MKELICQRVALLREAMRHEGIAAYVIPLSDPHASEYVPGRWATPLWLSGFGGSAATLAVTMEDAALWTDSRYFIAAESCLKGTPFHLMRDGLPDTPDVGAWLLSQLHGGEVAAADGWSCSQALSERMEQTLSGGGIKWRTDIDLIDVLWADRPALPREPIVAHALAYAGEESADKLHRLRQEMKAAHCNAMLVSALDDIAWALNLRGNDVHCNPVFLSYLLVEERSATLFVSQGKLTDEALKALQKAGVTIKDYDSITACAAQMRDLDLWLAPEVNARLYTLLSRHNRLIVTPQPLASMKAKKNSVEIEGFRRAMKRDGKAMVRFLHWLEGAVRSGNETEMSIDRKLTSLRAEEALYQGLSFDTIAGYGPHGAIVHYEASPESDSTLRPEGLLLLDSGAHYLDGTTDITRTWALGPLDEEEKRVYTLVLKGHITLSRCHFPQGTCGTQLDLAARYHLWQHGLNYGHGTGHGVGSYLCVHEGPHQIRMNYKPAPIEEGMTVTDEPGIYIEGAFGVRTENTLLVVKDSETAFGTFLRFEPLTLCPIDTRPILWPLLDEEDVAWLNSYHQDVRAQLLPLLEDESDRIWLREKTQARDRKGDPLPEGESDKKNALKPQNTNYGAH